jgi:hypothetical protein
MAGRGRAIHVFLVCVGKKTWAAGPSPAMTVGATHKVIINELWYYAQRSRGRCNFLHAPLQSGSP